MLGLGRDGWRRAGFELAVVFLGVLIALLVDGWNTRRMANGLERQYLARLTQDVAGDTTALRDLLRTLDGKTSALLWLQGQTLGDLSTAADSTELVRERVRAHSAGFGVLRGNSTSFEDLRSTGNLSLIRDPQLRARIVAYYEAWSFNADRVEARRSGFPALLYAVLPPEAYDADVYFDAPASGSDVELDLDLVAAEVLGEVGRRELRGELNYSRFFRGVVEDLLEHATELLRVLEGGPTKGLRSTSLGELMNRCFRLSVVVALSSATG